MSVKARVQPLWKTWDKLARKTGEHATVYHTNGDRYRGQYENNMRHGQGTLLYKNGNKYEGEFQMDKQHGFGTHWICKDGKLRMQYRGGFANGKRAGQGVLAYEDGGKYDGEWLEGKQHGQGKMLYAGGEVHEGSWAEGKRHGPGTLFLPNGDIFQGEYREDLKEGPGTFFYVAKNKRYDGVWAHDVAKCGLYADVDEAPSNLPHLTLADPIAVLEGLARDLERQRLEKDHAQHLSQQPDITDSGEYGGPDSQQDWDGYGEGGEEEYVNADFSRVEEEDEEEEEEEDEDYFEDGDEVI